MRENYEGLKPREPRVGDHVTIHACLCEWDGVSGQVIGISETDKEMPIMVQRGDCYTWPFSVHELELHSNDDEVYEGGWIDPQLTVQRK